MARRVLFILLSVVVFASAASSGYIYFTNQKAQSIYKKAQLEKTKVAAIVGEANRDASIEKKKRRKVERKLKSLSAVHAKTKQSQAELKKELVKISARYEEAKIKAVAAEEALKAAQQNSKVADKVKKNSSVKVARLEKRLKTQILKFKKVEAELGKVRQDLKTEREKRKKSVVSLKKSNQKTVAELKKKENDLKQVRLDLSNIQKALEKLKQDNVTLQTALATEKKKASTPSSDEQNTGNKEVETLKIKLAEVSQTLKAAQATITTLKAKVVESEKKAKVAIKQLEAKRTAGAATKKKEQVKVASLGGNNSGAAGNVDKQKSEDKKDQDREKELEERARTTQEELKRLGCYPGKVDGVWGKGSLEALVKFSKSANLDRVRKYPTKRTIEVLKAKKGAFCVAKKEGEQSKQPGTTVQTQIQTLRQQCLAACVGAFEDVRSCRDNC